MKRLQTVPGVGILTALCITSLIGDLRRFSSGHQLSSYLGLVPRENSSGERFRMGRITKAGCALTRKNLIHGARSVLTRKTAEDPMVEWARNIRAGQAPANVKTVALASKMARVVYALLRDGTSYQTAHRTSANCARAK